MIFAVLGNITFQATGSPETFEAVREYRYAEHPVVESQPLLQAVGDELETIAFEMLLHTSFTAPVAAVLAMRAAAEAHQAMPLVFGNGTHRGYFVIVKLTETSRQRADDGSIIAVMLKVELKQWARRIEVDPNAPPQPKVTPPAMVVGPLAPGQTVAGVVTTSGAVSFGSKQAGTSALVSNPPAPALSSPLPPADGVAPSTIWRMDTAAGELLT